MIVRRRRRSLLGGCQEGLRVSRLDSLVFVAPKAAMVRAGSRMVPVVAAATSQHLSAMEL